MFGIFREALDRFSGICFSDLHGLCQGFVFSFRVGANRHPQNLPETQPFRFVEGAEQAGIL